MPTDLRPAVSGAHALSLSTMLGRPGGSLPTETTDREAALLASMPLPAALLTGPSHVFAIANHLWRELVGPRELMGRPFAEAWPESCTPALQALMKQVFNTGESMLAVGLSLQVDRSASGRFEEGHFEVSLQAVRGADGEVEGLILIAIDITPQVAARLALERADVERQRLLADLQAASQSKDEFLATLGHELRNPLSPILTALRSLTLRGDPATAKERAVIHRQVNHLSRLIDDLLDVSHITRGVIELRHGATEVAHVFELAVEMTGALFQQRDHRLTIEVPAAGLVWYGDAARLAQVVSNLLTNAARYTPPGGKVLLEGKREGDELRIRVADNGLGIRADLLPRVFDLFVQDGRGVDRSEGGLGVGLALVRHLVGLHGGSVSATSEGAGRGSEFIIRLPLTQALSGIVPEDSAPHTLAEEPARQTAPGPESRRVLIVDDNEDAAESLADVLRLDGHLVWVSQEPLHALAEAQRVLPDAVVLDIGLPGMDGHELARRLREALVGRRCRLIALTGYCQRGDQERSKEAGIEAHLIKPVDLSELGRLLANP